MVTFLVYNDQEKEETEIFTLTLRDPLWPDGNRGDPYQLIVLIEDDDDEDEGR